MSRVARGRFHHLRCSPSSAPPHLLLHLHHRPRAQRIAEVELPLTDTDLMGPPSPVARHGGGADASKGHGKSAEDPNSLGGLVAAVFCSIFMLGCADSPTFRLPRAVYVAVWPAKRAATLARAGWPCLRA